MVPAMSSKVAAGHIYVVFSSCAASASVVVPRRCNTVPAPVKDTSMVFEDRRLEAFL